MNKLELDYRTVAMLFSMVDGYYVLTNKTTRADYRDFNPRKLEIIKLLDKFLKDNDECV